MSQRRRFCAACMSEIDRTRLQALPHTRLCLEHAREIEKYGGEMVLLGTTASLGKAGSLKMNYGDISISSRRNDEALRRLLDEYERRRWERNS